MSTPQRIVRFPSFTVGRVIESKLEINTRFEPGLIRLYDELKCVMKMLTSDISTGQSEQRFANT
ncbi:MAG: hypothetical protein SGJ05_03140 [bacterium]|nr:hypothetical protein [bacterium]